jgi:hypothetical protein
MFFDDPTPPKPRRNRSKRIIGIRRRSRWLKSRNVEHREVVMHLRHIRPRSVEWYDALETDGVGRTMVARLPDDDVRMRGLRPPEAMAGMTDFESPKLSHRPARGGRLDS